MCCAVYVFVSYRLFQLTGTLKTAVVPNKAGRELLRNVTLITITGAFLWLLSILLIRIGGWQSMAAPLADPDGDQELVVELLRGVVMRERPFAGWGASSHSG